MAAEAALQKAIRLGLAVDEKLTTSSIGAYIGHNTATYWLADDKGAGTVDLSASGSAKAARQNQSGTRPRAVSRARSASNCYSSSMAESMAETLHDSTVKLPSGQCLSSAPVPHQGAPGGLGRFETPRTRARATGRPATASGARASRLQSRRLHRL